MTTLMEAPEKRRILVVDDEELILGTLERLLRRLPAGLAAEVETATSAEDAEARLKEKRYSVILTDFNMGGRNGIELLEEARRRWPDTKRLLMTGYTDQGIQDAARERCDVAAFVRKPWDNRQLLATVGGLLGPE